MRTWGCLSSINGLRRMIPCDEEKKPEKPKKHKSYLPIERRVIKKKKQKKCVHSKTPTKKKRVWHITGEYKLKQKMKNEFRLPVLIRDIFTCQACSKHSHSSKLVAHHIKDKRKFPEDMYNPENGVALCYSCHTMYHNWISGGIYKKRVPATEDTFKEWIILRKEWFTYLEI